MPPPDDAPAPPFSGAEMISRLESGRRVIEQKFLEAGDMLAQAIDGIAALVAALDQLTSAIGPAAIAETSRQLSDAAAQLVALPGAQVARRRLIEAMAEQHEGLALLIRVMRRNLSYMRAYSFNVKITAAGIAAAESGFDVFAQEIAERIEAGHQEMDAVERALHGLLREIEAAILRADVLEEGCATLIPAVPDRLTASAATMAAHRGQVASAVTEAGALARDVRQKVSRVLAALQVGDSTRQRIEHVQQGIAMLDTDAPGLDGEAVMRVRAVAGALLKAQLEAALADFNRETQQIGIGLNGLAKDAAALVRLRELAYGKNSGDSDGILRALEQRVGDALALVNEIEQAASLAQATGVQAAGAVRTLFERLEAILAIKSDVLYMALNTTLKSARLGESGLPLGIIAKELRGHADELDVAATACAAALGELTTTAAALARQPEAAADQSAGTALTEAMARIHTAGEKTERDVAVLTGQGETVMALLTRSTQQLGLQDEIGAAVQEVVRRLGELGALAVGCEDDIRAPVAALFDQLGARYTMAQEREIQQAVAESFGVPAAVADVAAAVLEDALF